MRPPARLAPLVLLTVVSLAACGGDDDDGGGSGDAPTDGGFAAMLAAVPDGALGGDGAMLQYVDMQLVWERLGVGDGTAEERLEALPTTAQVDRYSLVPRLFGDMVMLDDEAREEVGFDITDIEREIAVDLPPSLLRIADVAVAPDVIDAATAADPVWSDRRQVVDAEDATYFDWTADGDELAQDLERRTPMRPYGVGGQLAVSEHGDGSRVVRTNESSLLEDALATATGDDGSAATQGPLAGAADAVDGDAVQAIALGAMSGMPVILSPEDVDRLEPGEGFIGPYRAIVLADVIAAGDTAGDDPITEVLLLHVTADAAEANVAAVEALLEDGVTTMSGTPVTEVLGDRGVEVEQDGTVVRVTVEPGHFSAIYSAIVRRDLFVTR
ncbi:MAG: hypothetical protein ABW122_13960 [Ilumatobacteraceae bacterium]